MGSTRFGGEISAAGSDSKLRRSPALVLPLALLALEARRRMLEPRRRVLELGPTKRGGGGAVLLGDPQKTREKKGGALKERERNPNRVPYRFGVVFLLSDVSNSFDPYWGTLKKDTREEKDLQNLLGNGSFPC